MPDLQEIRATPLKWATRAVLRRAPWLGTPFVSALNVLFRVVLLPFGHRRPRGTPSESSDLVARTDVLNRAAERYFATFDAATFLLGKPFTDSVNFPRHLFSLGVLLQGLRIQPSDVVLELGAGTCWVSHFVNRYGCKTISVDVSQTALDLGREVFRRDPATRWDLHPEFVVYDGHQLPLADGVCTKVIVVDAFHHIPNQREILRELHRVLAPDGMVAMYEPGVGHADTEASKHEVETYGVLENELVIEDVGALARDCGFADSRVVFASPALWEIPTDDIGPFMKGKGFVHFWRHQCDALIAHHYVLLYKGDPRPTTRHPKLLGVRIGLARKSLRATRGTSARLGVTLTNVAETRWLSGGEPGSGWTRLGAHLYRDGAKPELVDFDWFRAELPRDVLPGEHVKLPVELPPLTEPGTYRVVFDLVIEGIAWFAHRGSPTASATLVVE